MKLTVSGQQWDRPNGWAPLEYLAIEGLNAYGEKDLARETAERWIGANVREYAQTGVLVQKYDAEQGPERGGGGSRGGPAGECPLQAGFGWTNGVLMKLLAERPDLALRALRQSP